VPSPADIAHRFAFHPATTEEKRDAHTSVRQHCRDLADFLNDKLPEGREKSLALTAVEEAMLWGNAALARQNTEE
jgi:predicted secreted protein